MFSKFKNKESKATCPHCHKNLPNSILAHYFFNRLFDVSECPHCGTEIKPDKSLKWFILWQAFLVPFVLLLVNYFAFTYFELTLIQSLSIALLATAIVVVILYSVLYKKMKFEKV